eukprot:CAMPEP_0204854536 /NCGR_PEP_ID=MMETSP1347-20130617/15266_1 /ASSEMBLY_ACC=CAM_ASM_000690 /TAXON_ID=215587 /ORGANISM="Aplanochytrium stocchinoi, Strain GSBS06" /LENGTH=145 /DNA_ID=CAMNT_0052000139 /DNA_START=87 /DNA_END=524 /DNA_ORIENTATION=-
MESRGNENDEKLILLIYETIRKELKLPVSEALPDLLQEDANGATPLHLAVVCDNVPVIHALLSLAKAENIDQDVIELPDSQKGRTLLHHAAAAGKLNMVQFLLENGASESATDNEGLTPMQLASCNDQDAVVEFLVTYEGERRNV